MFPVIENAVLTAYIGQLLSECIIQTKHQLLSKLF